MDIPRIASPSSSRVLDQMSYHDRRPPISRNDSQTSSSFHTSRAPMTIPHNRPAEAPPPLPPPRFIEDLANGHDLGWRWGNSVGDGGFGKLAPIKQSSSLNGGYRRPPMDTSRDEEAMEGMDVDGDFDRRSSTVSTIRSPSHPEVFPGSLGYIQSGGKRTPSPSAVSNQRLAHSPVSESGHVTFRFYTITHQAVLRHCARRFGSSGVYAALRHDFFSLPYARPSKQITRMLTFVLLRLQGEKPLAQENFSRSSHAYDKHVLSKIGKGNSPPRQKSLGPGDNALAAQRLPSHPTDHNGVQRLSVTDLAVNSADSWAKWVTSPVSGGASPNSKHSWRDYNMGFRSPSVDSSGPLSMLDQDSHTRPRGPIRHSTSGSLPGLDDSVSSYSRSTRGSYDQAFFAEADADFPMEETGGFRKLNLGDPTPSDPDVRQTSSKQGMKRRALSPPAEASREDKALLYTADPYQKQGATTNYPRSPISRQDPSHGSVSSVSSASLRNNSYASSVGLSIAGSSMTSVSSLDTHSPGAISPLSEFGPAKDSPYITSVSLNPSQASITPARSHQQSRESKPVSTARKMSIQSAVNQSRQGNTSRIGAQFMCECCPKKPKKFESEEELR
jgi:hypothetical protein